MANEDPQHPAHDHAHSHGHDHGHDHSEIGPMDLRVRALETVLVAKGHVDPAALDALIDSYQTRIGPRNGARVVARAWTDPAFRSWLMSDATAAIALIVVMPLAGQGGSPTPPDIGWGLAAGLGGGFGAMLLFRGLGKGSMAVVAPITATGAAVIPVLFGIATGKDCSHSFFCLAN